MAKIALFLQILVCASACTICNCAKCALQFMVSILHWSIFYF
ncbi:hypothetical protein NC99_09470 [Sunxiuqinia dokdonensis]|uniref:Uncharacterized protein n=1 Tax=Sunxiuqinia dokdonensis TaxID=1409788 RepID=A0A0L8VCR1_9BACT|nr:hypothetical protein NC99_09470 [Sunxiuqinia dokdonensis]